MDKVKFSSLSLVGVMVLLALCFVFGCGFSSCGECKVSFDTKVDGLTYDAVELPKDSTFEDENKTLPTPTRTGYTFGGWYKNSDFSGDAFTVSTKVTKSIKLHAKWTKIDGGTPSGGQGASGSSQSSNEVRIIFYGNGGTVDSQNSTTITITKGHSLQQDGKSLPTATTAYADEIFDKWVQGNPDSTTEFTVTTVVTSNLSVYATWKASTQTPKYTITFDGNDGTVNGNSVYVEQPHEAGYSLYSPNKDNIVRSGYTFIGWYTERDGGTIVGNNIGFGPYTVTSDKTFYAHWQKN